MSPARRRPPIKEFISILEANFRALKIAQANAEVLQLYETLVEIVKNDRQILLLGNAQRVKFVDIPSESEEEIRNLTIEDVEELLLRDDLTRRFFERLASVRFGVPKGSMRQWGSRDSLLEKIATMMQNERMHRTIGEVARREKGNE